MKFEIIKLLHKINDLYKLPKGKERFAKYLYLLQGDTKNDLLLPIGGFNPMGNELASYKLGQLIKLKAEDVAQKELLRINASLKNDSNRIIQVGLNLVDDVEGSWSNYYTTDYTSKFEIEPLLKRNFCTPYFWTNETITEEMIIERVREYVYRTIFWITNRKPETLCEFMEQEIYVQINSKENSHKLEERHFFELQQIYKKHINSTDYNLKFNFFYGDKVSKLLAYSFYGIIEKDGFQYAKFIADKRK